MRTVQWAPTILIWPAVVWLLTTPAGAYTSGAPTDRCGRPPEAKTCQGCHGMTSVSANEDNLRLIGLGPRFDSRPEFKHLFVRGMFLPLRVEHHDPGRRRWGFQLVSVDPDTSLFQIGSLVVSDPLDTQIVTTAGGMQFIEHTFVGTCMTEEECFDGTGGCPDSHGWDFVWTAPPSVRAARFYFCSLAADADCSADTDDHTRCDAITAYPDPTLVLGPYSPSPSGYAYQASDAYPPFNLWMHTKPDFDELDGGLGPVLFGDLPGTFDFLPDCGGPICYYVFE